MSIDLTTIKTVQNAKDAEYNGRKLTDEEKKIFEHANLKSADDSALKIAVSLLEDVIKAEASAIADATLLASLKSKKVSENSAYAAINSVKVGSDGKYDAAIKKLEEFGKDSNQKIKGIETQINAVNAQLAEIKIEEDKAKAEKEGYLQNYKAACKKIRDQQKVGEQLAQFKKDLEDGSFPIVELKDIVTN